MFKILNKFKSIFGKKILKRLLGMFILLWLGTVLFSHNQAVAQTTPTTPTDTQQSDAETKEDKILNANEFFNTILQLVYVLIWPILVIIWWLIDNTVVYWSFLHLDASLWTLWNIVKNFANFALWFLVLFAIVRNVISPLEKSASDGWKPVTIIKNTLIAGILIQASWFLMAAIIDVSTILTYSIGWMPMTILQNSPATKDVAIVWVNAKLEQKDNGKTELSYYNTYGDANISPCVTKKLKWFTGDYIVGKKQIMIDDETYFYTGICTIGSWPYRFLENPNMTGYTGNVSYQETLKNYYENGDTETFSGLINNCHVIPLYKDKNYDICQWYGILDKDDNFFSSTTASEKNPKLTLDGLLEKSKWFVGPFITIYSSILDFTTITEPVNEESNLFNNFFNLIIKFFFAVALFFPLLALAVVLLARVWILWLAIAASPAIILVTVFGKVLGWWWDKILWKHLNIKNLMQLIFAPVFVVFAISMSLIFLSALNPRSIDHSDNFEEEQLAAYGIQKTEKSYSILWLVEVEMDMEKISKWKDTFAWFITNLFGVWVVWFFLFFAIKQMTWEVGQSVGKAIQDSVEKMAMNLPVIPVAGGIWISAAKSGLKSLWWIPDKITRQQEQKLKDKYPWLYDMSPQDTNRGETGKTLSDFGTDTKNTVIEWINQWRTMEQIWSELNQDQQNKLTTAGYAWAGWLASLYNQEISKEFTKDSANKDIIAAWKWFANNNIKSNADAQRFTADQINNSIASDKDWKDWAWTVLGGAIHTKDWVKVMDNVWTEDKPVYRVVNRDQYEKKYFWEKGLSEVKKEDLEKLKEGDNFNKEKFEKYKESMEEHEKELERLSNAGTLPNEDNLTLKQKQELKNYFELLNSNKLTTPPKEQTNNDWWWGDAVDSEAE